jgi:hypothetical protein
VKVGVAPRTLLLAACVLSPPYFCTVLTLTYEPGDWRPLENPRFVLRQRRYSRADATYGDDKNRLREHLSLFPPTHGAPVPVAIKRCNWGSRWSAPDSELTAAQFGGPLSSTDWIGGGLTRNRHGPRVAVRGKWFCDSWTRGVPVKNQGRAPSAKAGAVRLCGHDRAARRRDNQPEPVDPWA